MCILNVGPYARKSQAKIQTTYIGEGALQRLSDDTPMSVTERVRRYRERRRLEAALPEPMEVQFVAESFSEPMQSDFTTNDVMQAHWNAANERLRTAKRASQFCWRVS
jgi:hypothetical protein